MWHHHLAGADTAWEQGATCNGHTAPVRAQLGFVGAEFHPPLARYRGEYSWLLEAENVPNVSG